MKRIELQKPRSPQGEAHVSKEKWSVMMLRQEHAHLDLTKVGEGAWRVSDARIPERNALRVIAFIECCGGTAEVVWLRGSRSAPSAFAGLDEALDAVAAFIDADGSADSRRPVPIPHLPPPMQRGM